MSKPEAPEANGIGYARDKRGVRTADPLVGLGLISRPRTAERKELSQNSQPRKVTVRIA